MLCSPFSLAFLQDFLTWTTGSIPRSMMSRWWTSSRPIPKSEPPQVAEVSTDPSFVGLGRDSSSYRIVDYRSSICWSLADRSTRARNKPEDRTRSHFERNEGKQTKNRRINSVQHFARQAERSRRHCRISQHEHHKMMILWTLDKLRRIACEDINLLLPQRVEAYEYTNQKLCRSPSTDNSSRNVNQLIN